MPVDGFFLGIYISTLLINTAIAAVFFKLIPKQSDICGEWAARYLLAYFVVSFTGYLAIISRFFLPLTISAFLTNFLFLLAAYCILFGCYWRYKLKYHIHRHFAIWHLIAFSSLQGFMAYFFPEQVQIRVVLAYVNIMAVLLFALSLFGRFGNKDSTGEKLIHVATIVAVISIVMLPVAFVISDTVMVFTSYILLIQNAVTMTLFGAFLASFLFDSIRLYQKTSITDGMTSLYNRQYFLEQGARFMKSAERHQFPVSIIMCDIDEFKLINDNYGHAIGDKAIVAVANTMKSSTREPDLVARIGGEEFIALLPQTNSAGAMLFAERLRKKISELTLSTENGIVKLTVSVGVTSLQNHTDIEAGMKAADTAMYEAKKRGRNAVFLDSEGPAQQANGSVQRGQRPKLVVATSD